MIRWPISFASFAYFAVEVVRLKMLIADGLMANKKTQIPNWEKLQQKFWQSYTSRESALLRISTKEAGFRCAV